MAKLTSENAMKRLEAIVEDLEGGQLSLDEALRKFQEGIKLTRFCSDKLDETERKVSILLRDEKGGVRAEPFLPEEDKTE